MECFRCGVSGDRIKLYDAISKEGIVKICESCSFKEDIPIIQKPTNFQLQESERKQTVHERLSSMAGIKEDKFEKNISKPISSTQQEVTLRSLVDKNFKSKIEEKIESNNNLINNFHWVLMRTRRLKHITQKQLAEAIFESEVAIEMAEKGILPENSDKLIQKIENYLGIKLFKQGNIKEANFGEHTKQMNLNSENTKTLTISDLQELNKRNEEEIFSKIEDGIGEKIEDVERIPEYEDYDFEMDEDNFE